MPSRKSTTTAPRPEQQEEEAGRPRYWTRPRLFQDALALLLREQPTPYDPETRTGYDPRAGVGYYAPWQIRDAVNALAKRVCERTGREYHEIRHNTVNMRLSRLANPTKGLMLRREVEDSTPVSKGTAGYRYRLADGPDEAQDTKTILAAYLAAQGRKLGQPLASEGDEAVSLVFEPHDRRAPDRAAASVWLTLNQDRYAEMRRAMLITGQRQTDFVRDAVSAFSEAVIRERHQIAPESLRDPARELVQRMLTSA